VGDRWVSELGTSQKVPSCQEADGLIPDSEPPVGGHDRCVFWMVVGTLT